LGAIINKCISSQSIDRRRHKKKQKKPRITCKGTYVSDTIYKPDIKVTKTVDRLNQAIEPWQTRTGARVLNWG